ncbi:MAG TPA: putative nucleotidyltransferase substrate binding domain-containing protein [Methylomirabilota bacterium]|nr:putative nucleotidyltransferase substrate binding domain-containing protein [Methylomirabilota bacterium]
MDSVTFLARHHPFDVLPAGVLADLAASSVERDYADGDPIYEPGDDLDGIVVVCTGGVDLVSPDGERLQRFGAGEGVGVRTILRDGVAANRAVADGPVSALLIAKAPFLQLLNDYPAFDRFYDRARSSDRRRAFALADETPDPLFSALLGDVMTPAPIVVAPTATAREAAASMRSNRISCVLVADDDGLVGILTTGDLTARVVAEGLDSDTPVAAVMTRSPIALPPTAILHDAMVLMSERRLGHLPVTVDNRPVGIVTRTDLVRRQSASAVHMIGDIARADDDEALRAVVARTPQLLAQFVGAGVDAHRVAAVITSVTDALTRRLIVLAQQELGPAPVPWLWLACGSQGRREQTGVSDQDNCLMLDERYDPAEHGPWFKAFARFVCDGLHAAGYVYCPGDMMATNPTWRQPVQIWRGYFAKWIARPDPMAQMLSSVMFDLRPIDGEAALFAGLQRETLDLAQRNSIFRAHMIANSLKHTAPLGLFRGFALIRSGEHKDTVDLKLNGIVPIVDLARVYALDAGIEVVNTRERLAAAREAGTLSQSGADDLIDALDLISDIRLEHQARLIRAGRKPDNFLAPSQISALERNHLKDAFGVVKSLQSSLSQVRGLS